MMDAIFFANIRSSVIENKEYRGKGTRADLVEITRCSPIKIDRIYPSPYFSFLPSFLHATRLDVNEKLYTMCVQCVHTCYYACISNRWNSISDENRRGWGKIEVDETGYTKEKSKWRKWSKEERREKEEEWEGEREREKRRWKQKQPGPNMMWIRYIRLILDIPGIQEAVQRCKCNQEGLN